MKQSILILFSLFVAQVSFGQDWQPIYLNETLNYQSSANPEETIGIFASDLSGFADSSDVRLTLDTDTLDDCACDLTCFRLKADFLQSSITYLAEGVVAFQNPDTFYYIHTKASLGDSWVFQNDSSGNDISATVISLSVAEILGEPDSLKIISLSNEEEIELSKNHGITKWISATDTLSLHSIPKRGLGEQPYLTKAEVYDFNVGDVFCYTIDEIGSQDQNGFLYTDYTRSVRRFEVISVVSNDSSIQVGFLKHNAFTNSSVSPNSSQTTQGSDQDTIYVEIDLLSYENIYELPKKKYWYQGVDVGIDDGYFFIEPQFVNINFPIWSELAYRMNYSMLNNRKTMSYGLNDFDFEFTDQTSITDILDVYLLPNISYDFLVRCSWNEDIRIFPGDTMIDPFESYYDYGKSVGQIVGEGLGVVAYSLDHVVFENYYTKRAVMIGYEKGNETVGYVPAIDSLIGVGLPHRSNQINFSMYPNPAGSSLQVVLPISDFGTLKILDISGREVFTTSINSEKVEIDTSQFPAGVYLVRVETQNGIGVKKIVVAR